MTIFEIISASVNVLLVGIIVLSEMRARRTRPKLKVRLDSTSGASNVTQGGAEGRYFIINIVNKNVLAPAVNVKLLIVRMRRSGDAESWRECPVNGPVQVSWRRPDDMSAIVNVGADVQCTVLALIQGESSATILLLGAVPNNFEHKVTPNEYIQLGLRAVADNCQTREYTVQMFWDGLWPEEGIEGHIQIVRA